MLKMTPRILAASHLVDCHIGTRRSGVFPQSCRKKGILSKKYSQQVLRIFKYTRAVHKSEGGLIYNDEGYSSIDSPMELVVNGPFGAFGKTALITEIPSFEAGLIAFFFVFLLMGLMHYVLRSDRNKMMPQLSPLGPKDVTRLENPLSSSDAAYIGMITLVILELALDALIVVSALQGMGSIALGTMLALATFLAAAILAVYRSTYMSEAFTRKPRLELVAANLLKKANEDEEHD